MGLRAGWAARRAADFEARLFPSRPSEASSRRSATAVGLLPARPNLPALPWVPAALRRGLVAFGAGPGPVRGRAGEAPPAGRVPFLPCESHRPCGAGPRLRLRSAISPDSPRGPLLWSPWSRVRALSLLPNRESSGGPRTRSPLFLRAFGGSGGAWLVASWCDACGWCEGPRVPLGYLSFRVGSSFAAARPREQGASRTAAALSAGRAFCRAFQRCGSWFTD